MRREMEKENHNSRKKARKQYNELLRNLIQFIKKRDKRVIQYNLQQAIEQEKKSTIRKRKTKRR